MLWRTGLSYLFVIIFTNTRLFDEGEGPVNKDCLHKPKKLKLCECENCGFVAETNEEREKHIRVVSNFFAFLAH